MKKRLVITGMGAVTPLGVGVTTFWQGLSSGKCGIRKITKFDTENINVKVAGEVNINYEDYMSSKQSRKMSDFMKYAYIAGSEALEPNIATLNHERTGIVMASALNGISLIAQTEKEISTGEHQRVSPLFFPEILPNEACTQLSITYDLHGPSLTVATACSSSNDAVTTAAMLLQSDMADAILVIGGEAPISPLVASSLSSARALSFESDPEFACCPFDSKRNGFVMGEGGGAILLETLEHAQARNATIYCELLGYSNNVDAYHVTAPRQDGLYAAKCMQIALQSAGLKPEDIDYINAHATSTTVGDISECNAIHEVFGELATKIPVSSTKGATGHLLGVAGLIESIACIMAIKEQIIPPTLHLKEQDQQCNIDCVPNIARKANISTAMTNSFGFGGQNSCLIFGTYK